MELADLERLRRAGRRQMAREGRRAVRRFGGFIGVSFIPYSYGEQIEPRALGDFSVPVNRRWDLLLGAQIGPGEERTQWAATVGFRVAP